MALPAEAGPLKKPIGRLKPHAATQQQSKAACPCNSAACTGKPGCACGEAGCTCNGPTQVAKQDQPKASAKPHSLLRRAAGKTDPPQSPAAPLEQAPAAPAGPEEKAAKKSASVDLSPDESRLFAGLNRLRKSRGKPPVVIDPILMQVCHERVNTLPDSNPHNSPQYGWAPRHAARYAKWSSVNDVVAGGYWSDGSRATPEQSCDAWRQSDGHLRCILGQSNINNRWIDEGYDRVGVARGRKFDLAVFGRRGN